MAYTLVNTSTLWDAASATTTVAPATALTTGNTIIVQARCGNQRIHTGVTDTAGNTYTMGWRAGNTGLGTRMETWYCINATGHASNVVTATLNAAGTARGLLTAQFAGSSTHTNIMRLGSEQAGNTPVWYLAGLNVPACLIVAGLSNDNTGATWTPGAGFSTVVADASTVQYMQWRELAAPTTDVVISASGNSGTSRCFNALVFAEPGSMGAYDVVQRLIGSGLIG